MTKLTRYEQGFLNKCAEYGVPKQVAGVMLKRATGLGSNQDNRPNVSINTADRKPAGIFMHPGSYGYAVAHNTDSGASDYTGTTPVHSGYTSDGDWPSWVEGAPLSETGGTDFEPQQTRVTAAIRRADKIFPSGSDNWHRLIESLVRAGRLNEKYYRRGTLPHRVKPDMTGIENLPLTEEQLDKIRQWQNTQARVQGAARTRATV